MNSSSLRLVAICFATVLIAVLDYVTGDELDLFILYFLPIAAAAWWVGPRAAVVLAFLAAGFWFSANVYLGHAYTQPWMGVWGEGVMLLTFLAIAIATTRIRTLLEHERILNGQLAEALAKVKKLSGRLPICIGCKSIRDDLGGWHEIEEYFTVQSEEDFIFHQTLCPHCRVPAGGDDSIQGKNMSPEPVVVG